MTSQKKGQIKFSEFTDLVKQIVYIGVIDPAESKYGLIFEIGILLHCHFGYFCQTLKKKSEKLVGQIGSQIRPLQFSKCLPFYFLSMYCTKHDITLQADLTNISVLAILITGTNLPVVHLLSFVQRMW